MPSARYILRIRYIASRRDMFRFAERKGKIRLVSADFLILLYFAFDLLWMAKFRAPLRGNYPLAPPPLNKEGDASLLLKYYFWTESFSISYNFAYFK